jgi:hypothetical protein
MSDYRSSISLNPSYLKPYRLLATLYRKSNDFYSALDCLNRALRQPGLEGEEREAVERERDEVAREKKAQEARERQEREEKRRREQEEREERRRRDKAARETVRLPAFPPCASNFGLIRLSYLRTTTPSSGLLLGRHRRRSAWRTGERRSRPTPTRGAARRCSRRCVAAFPFCPRCQPEAYDAFYAQVQAAYEALCGKSGGRGFSGADVSSRFCAGYSL